MVSVRVVRCALPAELVSPVADRLGAALGRRVPVLPWEPGAEDGDVLLLAPYALSDAERQAVIGAVRWSWVHLASAGVDFVDVAGWDPDVLLTRSWRCYAGPLAEYALHAVLTHEWREQAPWERPAGPPRVAGLWGARVGVAGWGPVGQRVGAVAGALGASVLALTRRGRPDQPDAAGAAAAAVIHTTRLDDVLDVDHLVVALPLTPATNGLLDRDALRRARTGLHLVNLSRPQIVDQAALQELCAAGRLSATLDVTEPEPLPADHPLRHLPGVRVSDHVAWRSRDSDLAFVDDFATAWLALAGGDGRVPGAVNACDARRARAGVRGRRPR
jgi:phosphoglycerate dehydrogenase-like enzyme